MSIFNKISIKNLFVFCIILAFFAQACSTLEEVKPPASQEKGHKMQKEKKEGNFFLNKFRKYIEAR